MGQLKIRFSEQIETPGGLRVLNMADHKNMLKKDKQKSQVLGKGSQLCPEDQIHANRHINLGDISSYGFHNFF